MVLQSLWSRFRIPSDHATGCLLKEVRQRGIPSTWRLTQLNKAKTCIVYNIYIYVSYMWYYQLILLLYGGFLKWWYPRTIGFQWSFWGVLGVPPFKETPILPESKLHRSSLLDLGRLWPSSLLVTLQVTWCHWSTLELGESNDRNVW